ncbi:MAG TPA: hypothetical protein VGD71_24810 [Kribbella sp.]
MRNAGESRRTVAPVLTLFLLAPLVGEVLGAAMRLSYLVQPLRVLGVMFFYGAGVVLIREVARRLGLSWRGVALLALAFALVEEGLALQTIFNPAGPGEDTVFGRVAGVNWFWAVVVCGYHVVWSVLVPIAVVECLFPQRRRSAWLSKRATAVFGGLFLLGAAAFLLISFLRSDYRLPLGLAAATLLLVAASAWAATRCVAVRGLPDPAPRRAPRPATVAWFGLLAGIGWFVLHLVAFIGGAVSFVLWTAIAVVLAAASVALVRRWTRSAWTPRHVLALAFGVMMSATLFGLFLVLADGRPENTVFQLVLLVALPAAYQVLKRRYTPQPVG